MALVVYPDYRARELYGLPMNLADPLLLENTLNVLSFNDQKIHLYTEQSDAICSTYDTINRMKYIHEKGGKSDLITIWNDIIHIKRSECMKGNGFVLYQIIDEYIRQLYYGFDVTSTILKGNNSYLVILGICTTSSITGIPLDIHPRQLYWKSKCLQDIIYKYTCKPTKCKYEKPDIEFRYSDYINSISVIQWLNTNRKDK